MGHMEEKRRRNTGDAGVSFYQEPTNSGDFRDVAMTCNSVVTVCVQRKRGAAHVTITGLRRVLYMGQQECQEKDGEDEELSDCKHEV